MTDEVELIHRRIEEIKANTKDKQFANPYNTGRVDLCNELLSLIDSMQEEPVSEDLEEFALQYAGHHAPYDSCMQEVEDAVKEGAKWQKQQLMKNATVAEYWDNWLILDPYLRGSFADGDKVKVIILKQEED